MLKAGTRASHILAIWGVRNEGRNQMWCQEFQGETLKLNQSHFKISATFLF